MKDGAGWLRWRSVEVRAPGLKELRLVPAGSARGQIAPRVTGPGSQQALSRWGGMSDCTTDGFSYL